MKNEIIISVTDKKYNKYGCYQLTLGKGGFWKIILIKKLTPETILEFTRLVIMATEELNDKV